MRKLFILALLSFAILTSNTPASTAKEGHGHDEQETPTSGHDDHGPVHGGQFFEAPHHHGVEMVVKEKDITFYMTVEGKPLDMTGTKFKAVIQTEAGTKMHVLTSEGSTLKTTLDAPLPKGAKIAVTGKDSHGDVLQARFVKE